MAEQEASEWNSKKRSHGYAIAVDAHGEMSEPLTRRPVGNDPVISRVCAQIYGKFYE